MKTVLTFLLIPFISSCASRKCCPDLFSWSKGPPPHAEFQYNIALNEDDKIFTLGGINGGAFEMYDVRLKKWIDYPALPETVAFCSGVILNHDLYVMGGMDSIGKNSDRFHKFDVQQKKWIELPDLSVPRSRSASVTYKNKIYLIGGLESVIDQHAKNSPLLETYDPAKGIWERKADMTVGRHGHAAIVSGNKIIVAGGYVNEEQTTLVEAYDPETNTWSRLADLPFPNAFFGLVTVGNTIYTFGGRLKMETGPILKYDADADQWSQVGSMPEVRNRFGIAATERKVYIIGGEENPKSVWIGKKL